MQLGHELNLNRPPHVPIGFLDNIYQTEKGIFLESGCYSRKAKKSLPTIAGKANFLILSFSLSVFWWRSYGPGPRTQPNAARPTVKWYMKKKIVSQLPIQAQGPPRKVRFTFPRYQIHKNIFSRFNSRYTIIIFSTLDTWWAKIFPFYIRINKNIINDYEDSNLSTVI